MAWARWTKLQSKSLIPSETIADETLLQDGSIVPWHRPGGPCHNRIMVFRLLCFKVEKVAFDLVVRAQSYNVYCSIAWK